MTEDEAKTKWCPMVRTGLVAGMAVNAHVTDDKGKLGDIYEETRCRASACMMWRWHHTAKPHMLGFCGLAGTGGA